MEASSQPISLEYKSFILYPFSLHRDGLDTCKWIYIRMVDLIEALEASETQ
jgi:hypothetical protein